MAVVVVAAVVAIGGVGVGFGLQRVLSDDGAVLADATVGTPAREVGVRPCPDEPEVDRLHAGDRVLVTGVHAGDPAWLRIRDPRDPGVALWVPATAVTADADLTELPEVECDPALVLASPRPLASPSPSPSPGQSPSPDAQTPTPRPTVTPSTTPSPTPTPTRTPTETPSPDPTQTPTEDPTEEPVPITFGSFDSDDDAIHPSPANFSYNCSAPQYTEIRVSVSHPSGIKSVTFKWTAAARDDNVSPERSGDQWSILLHGFVDGEDDPGPIQVTVTATANDGSTASTSWSGVTLLECT